MTSFRRLHQGPAILVLPNAWDAGSACLIESLRARAVATTSAGLAWSRGYPDGNVLPNHQLFAAVRNIARTIRVPLSVDIEEGYSEDERTVALLAAGVMDAGAAGINIEDGAAMATIAAAIDPMPLNVMAAPGLPPIEALQKYGIRRLSAGSSIAQAAWGCTSRLAAAFLAGNVAEIFGAAAEYGKMNELFARNNLA